MKNLYYTVLMAFTMLCTTSCDDTTNTIGQSLTDNSDLIDIATATFPVTTQSLKTDSVLSKSTIGYLGHIVDPETYGYISCDFMAQFHTVEDFNYPEESSIVTDDSKEIKADSCEIRLFYNQFYGDSLAKMKVTVHEMKIPMSEGENYYSNFNPKTKGFLRDDANAMKKSKTFALANQEVSDSLKSTSSYVRSIRIPLNDKYTDINGKEYSNYGTYLMQKLFENKSNFTNSYKFIHNICPGFYFELEDGLGSMAYITLCQLNVYYRYLDSDDNTTVRNSSLSFSATEEVLQTSTITNDKEIIKSLTEETSHTYLKTPAGIFTEMTLPVLDIMDEHRYDSLSSAKIVLQTINNKSQLEYAFDDPQTLLMVEKDSLYKFFENSYIADNKTSFLASLSNNTYTFGNVSNLIKYLDDKRLEAIEQGNPNWAEEHPNWNKVVLVPVTTTYVTTSSGTQRLARVLNDMSLTSTRLIGGADNPYEQIKIDIVYSRFRSN